MYTTSNDEIRTLRGKLKKITVERNAYRDVLKEISEQDPMMVGCTHKHPCGNSCAMLYSVSRTLKKEDKSKHTGCAKGLAQRVLDYFKSR